ncbi:hypothetical protein N9609_00695 [bacterium]|nr:hypothetical protein [bacterium]
MKIEKTTGNIVIKTDNDEIEHIIATDVFIQKHPRNEKGILISKTPTNQDENEAIMLFVDRVTSIDGVTFSGDRNDLLIKLSELFKKGGADGVGSGKTYVQTFKTTKTFSNGNATLLNLFPEVTIHPNKKVRLDIYVPTRDNTTSWGGLYVNVNAKVNGTWYNLGNTGYDGGVMAKSANSIHALNHEMILDFVGNLNLDPKLPFTLQFELKARSYDGTTTVNGSHDINKTANGLGSRGALQTWASDQNFTHLIITEINR